MPDVSLRKIRYSASFAGLRPASAKASRMASKASRKCGTKCEMTLRRALRARGLRFTTNGAELPGCPDIIFRRERVAVFADGDFWHGRNLADRIARLANGHNSKYWIRKIQSNVARDRRVRRQLNALGWRVVRVWESDIRSNIERVTIRIAGALVMERCRGDQPMR